MISYKSDVEAVDAFVEKYNTLRAEIAKVIVGQDEVVQRVLISIFSRGHGLLVGVPGLAKTLLVNTISRALGLSYSRIQFTPDLMPSDIIGTEILDEERKFKFIRGPVFANIILADEINRTPPKTQSALLEAMQEKAITVAGKNYKLSEPFFVLATQNPIEQEGTYPLPEAQVDRFMLKVIVGYPDKQEELTIMDRMTAESVPTAGQVVGPEDIIAAREAVRAIYVDPKIKQYIVDVVFATREPATYGMKDLAGMIAYGASPRASIFLSLAAKAHAFLRHRGYVTPEDVKAIGPDVLRHRVIVTYEAEAEEVTSDQVVRQIFDHVEIP